MRGGTPASDGERLQKVLARAGFASRRASEDVIRQGRVTVNGVVVRELGTRVRAQDALAVDGKPVVVGRPRTYLLLNKPPGHVTTTHDPHGRPTVLSLLPPGARLFPVGRLDVDSEGLLLLTDDGELTHRLTHPSHAIEKEYAVVVVGPVDDGTLNRLRAGVDVDGWRSAPATVDLRRREGDHAGLRFVIHEGHKRQIRRMCEAVGLRVARLVRTRVGPLRLGGLPSGAHRRLLEDEVREVRRAVGLGDQVHTGPVIAIDGPAGSGKSSLGALLARRHDFLYLDTGAMYRAVALLALRRGLDPCDEEAVCALAEHADIEVTAPEQAGGLGFTVFLGGEDVTWELYTPEVGRHVSVVSAYPRVREALLQRQREIAARGNAVVVGRDIGTVVLPDAPIKIYLDASDSIRAERRLAQLRERGIASSFDQVLEEIRMRDKLDSERAMAPLSAAPDAVVLNTDRMTVDEEVSLVDGLLRRLREDG